MPTKTELAKFSLRGIVTETGANTFTETAVNTNLTVEGNMIFIATGLWFGHNFGLGSASDELGGQLTYAPQSAIIKPNDPDWIFGFDFRTVLTTSGMHIQERLWYTNIDNFPIAQDQIFFGLAGVSLASAATAWFKLEGYLQKVTVTDFFRIQRIR